MSAEVSKYHIKNDMGTNKSVFAVDHIKAVAEQSWWRKTSKRRLAEEHSLTEAQIDELRATPEYQKVVESLMLGQRSPQDFEKWIKKYKNMPRNFGNRMGLDPGTIPGMIKRARQGHSDIAAGKTKLPRVVVNPSLKKGRVRIEMNLYQIQLNILHKYVILCCIFC